MPRTILYTGKAESADEHRGRDGASLRRKRAAHGRALDRSGHSLSDSLEAELGPSPRT
jgi:hypothetical protein